MASQKPDPKPNSKPAAKYETTYQPSRGGYFPAPKKPVPGTRKGNGGRLPRG